MRYSLRRAECTDLLGLNPWELGRKDGSKIASRTECNAFCTILSRGEPIPRGRFLPSDLGISILLPGLNSKVPLRIISAVFTNQDQDNPSRVNSSDPGVMLPFLLEISS